MGESPIAFICPKARRNRVMHHNGTRLVIAPHDRTHRITRTGRTKDNPTRRPGTRALLISHEYRCTCGHTGWTTHMDILLSPEEN
jgi:hypothetical protein